MKIIFIFFLQNCFNLYELKHFVQKKTIVLWRGIETGTIFKSQAKSIFKKIFFAETNETNVGHLHSFCFCFC